MPDCNKCGKPIEWMKSKNGKSIPVDSKPVPIQTEKGVIQGFRSHFDTCSARQQSQDSGMWP